MRKVRASDLPYEARMAEDLDTVYAWVNTRLQIMMAGIDCRGCCTPAPRSDDETWCVSRQYRRLRVVL